MMPTLASALVAISRSPELMILVKATAILACGLAAARLAGRAQASVRHVALAVTFAAVIALPLLVVAGPAIAISVPVERPAPTTNVAPPADAAAAAARSGAAAAPVSPALWPTLSAPVILRFGWFAASVTLLGALAAGLWRLGRLRRRALPLPELTPLVNALARDVGIRRHVEVLEHEQLAAPVMCGIRRPAILLPAAARHWTDADRRRALVHEMEHVRRGDWALQIAVKTACAVYWFHPLAWIAARWLCLEAERACDDAVVDGGDRMDYADQLVMLARHMSGANPEAIVGMAVRSDLSARVTALLDDTQRRGRAGLLAAVSATVVAATLVLAVAPVRAVGFDPTPSLRPGSGAAADQQGGRRRGPERRVRGLDRAIYEAAENGDIGEIDDLLRAGANVNSSIDGDGSPLIAAARTARLAVARHLLDRGADPNMGVSGDGSPLIAAAAAGALDVVSLLLERGAAVDQVVPGDENALIQACGEGHLEVVKLLVARGADVHARVWAQQGSRPADGEWRTPLSMARRGQHAAVIALLQAAGARE
jgi:beta-lactamase regulating signal transducer with metallopeptidase domain